MILNNSDLDIGNDGIVDLEQDSIETLSPKLDLTMSSNSLPFTLGARIYQKTSNAEATSSV